MRFRPCMMDTCHWDSGPSCQTGLLTVSGPSCQTGLLTVSGPSCQNGLLMLKMKAQHSLKHGTTLPLTHCHMPDLIPNCTTVRTSNVTGAGLHLVVCCSVDQAGLTGRHDSHTQHTACHTSAYALYPCRFFHSILSLSSQSFPSPPLPYCPCYLQPLLA